MSIYYKQQRKKLNLMSLKLFRDNWEQTTIFAAFNLDIKSKPMKVTAFILKTARRNLNCVNPHIFFSLVSHELKSC